MVACNPVYVWGIPRQTGFTCPRPKSRSVAQLRVAIKSSTKIYYFRLCLLWDIEECIFTTIYSLKELLTYVWELKQNKPKPGFKIISM